MAKLTRKLQKIFAQSASSDQLTVFGTEKTGSPIDSTDVETLQGGSYSYGWDGAIKNDKAPYLSEMNGVQYGITYQLAYMLQHGIPEYISTETYYKGNFVKVVGDSDVKIYYSLIDDNINNDPTTDKESWKEFSGGGSGLEVGDIGTSVYVDESKNLRRYLNGGLILQSQFVEFTNRIKQIIATQPTLACTEQEWQAEALLNVDGCVYKFVIDDNAGTIRLPKYPEYVEITADKLAVVGNGMTLGLTNGTNYAGLLMGASAGGNKVYLAESTPAYGNNIGQGYTSTALTQDIGGGVTTDPTKSGIETTGGVTKLKLRYFIQVATGQETQADIINTLQLANPYTLFDYKYTEAPLYNACWTLANGSWVSGAVQVTAYEGLAVEQNAEIAQGTTVTLPSGTSYTKRGLSVKVAGDSSITDYDFVLDTANTRFKLPTKAKLAGKLKSSVPVVGDGRRFYLGATNTTKVSSIWTASNSELIGISNLGYSAPLSYPTNPEYSTLIVDLSSATDTTDLYLYFYTGEIEQNANLVNIGRIEEQLANKEDIDTWVYFQDGTSGYRYNKHNGYCEQWGIENSPPHYSTVHPITFVKNYADNNYNILTKAVRTNTTWSDYDSGVYGSVFNKRVDGFSTYTHNTLNVYWKTSGYLAEGEY